MPKVIPTEELDAIVDTIATYPEGLSINDIRQALEFNLPSRTLQRRLKRLEDDGRISSIGTGAGKRYAPISSKESSNLDQDSGLIGLSDDGKEVKQLVIRPVTERTPVGHHPEFLESYIPNQTAYLGEELLSELEEAGQVDKEALPAGTYVRQIMNRLLIDLSWNSSRLEGNTYSLLDTQRLLDAGESAEGKDAEETQMILNHKAAIEMLAEQAREIGFNRYTICNLHALLSENLLPDPSAGGLIRSKPVGITGTVFEPLGIPPEIESSFDLMLEKAEAIQNPFEQAFFIMVQLPYLQPFEDVNKRVSRLATNIPLIRHNLCPLSFVDVDQNDYIRATLGIYELNRVDYLRDVYTWAYHRSCARYSAIRQSLGKPDPFRLRYRETIGLFVARVVQDEMDKRAATKWIAEQSSKDIPPTDQPRFIEVVETELGGLHEGNIARYHLRPSEFTVWKKGWQ